MAQAALELNVTQRDNTVTSSTVVVKYTISTHRVLSILEYSQFGKFYVVEILVSRRGEISSGSHHLLVVEVTSGTAKSQTFPLQYHTITWGFYF